MIDKTAGDRIPICPGDRWGQVGTTAAGQPRGPVPAPLSTRGGGAHEPHRGTARPTGASHQLAPAGRAGASEV